MALGQGLSLRKLARPGGRIVTVVIRRSGRGPVRPSGRRVGAVGCLGAERPAAAPAATTPPPAPAVPRGPFSPPVMRALAVLGRRALPLGVDGVALDGARAPLATLVAEANRILKGRGIRPIAYPGVPA